MSEYKRFMAYLYTYEKGQKAGNCGFAKVMVKNDDGFVNLHMKVSNQKARTGCTVYLYYRSQDKTKMYGVPIGELVISNGVGEGSIHFSAEAIGNKRRPFSEMGGLYLVSDTGMVMATEWEDIPVRPEYFELESEQVEEPENGSSGSVEMVSEQVSEPEEAAEILGQEVQQAERQSEQSELLEMTVHQEQMQSENEVEQEITLESAPQVPEPDVETESEPEMTVTDDSQIHAASASVEEKPMRMCMVGRDGCCPYRMEERKREANYKSEERRTVKELERISPVMDKWTQLKSKYPVVSPFDDDDSITCIRIQPKDICLLNRREWILGNNNFLLHGYCNYRYLLLGKIEAEGKYIICVPGNFYSKEKMMASMFGFQNFKMAGSGELRQGEFGYWYKEIEL